MCGIIGIVTYQGRFSRPLGSVIRSCLKNLEYRGYDSVGFAIIASDGGLIIRKSKGKIDDVIAKLAFDEFDGSSGIGHTRWATHGKPSDINAHPQIDCSGRVATVHNGIIENYLELREYLIKMGHTFSSETDTEVVPHLVEEFKKRGMRPYDSFKKTVSLLRGSYALAVIDLDEPDKIFFARHTSPLVIGLADGAVFLSSDIPAFLDYTRRIIVLQDGEVGFISLNSITIERLNDVGLDFNPVTPRTEIVRYEGRVRLIDWTPEMAKRGGYPHFMLKEIHEQPQAVALTINNLGNGIDEVVKLLSRADRILLVGAGSSYHASLIGSLLLTELAQMKSYAVISSEIRWFIKGVDDGDVIIAVSQSGETIDTLMAVREARRRGALTIALVNVIDSAISRESHFSIYTRAGPEIGVAATKTFTAQVAALSYLAIRVSELKGTLPRHRVEELKSELSRLPEYMANTIAICEARARSLSRYISSKPSAFYLGRGLGVPLSMEGALKLKEIAYIHAEAYPAGESKHGPIALVDEGFPTIFTILSEEDGNLILSNVEEMKARGAWTIAVAPKKLEKVFKLFDYVFEVPTLMYEVAPATYIIPHQLIAYYTAITRGYDPDKPRNLAKTVTVA